MEEWQTRVLAEEKELRSKLCKLQNFLTATGAKDRDDYVLLARQARYMRLYLDVLNERIDTFTK